MVAEEVGTKRQPDGGHAQSDQRPFRYPRRSLTPSRVPQGNQPLAYLQGTEGPCTGRLLRRMRLFLAGDPTLPVSPL